jgi:hypothetical protein
MDAHKRLDFACPSTTEREMRRPPRRRRNPLISLINFDNRVRLVILPMRKKVGSFLHFLRFREWLRSFTFRVRQIGFVSQVSLSTARGLPRRRRGPTTDSFLWSANVNPLGRGSSAFCPFDTGLCRLAPQQAYKERHPGDHDDERAGRAMEQGGDVTAAHG